MEEGCSIDAKAFKGLLWTKGLPQVFMDRRGPKKFSMEKRDLKHILRT